MGTRSPTAPSRWPVFALPVIIPFVILVCHNRSSDEKTYPAIGVAIDRYVSGSSQPVRNSRAADQPLAPPQTCFPESGDTVVASRVVLRVEHVWDSTGRPLPCEFTVYTDPEMRTLVMFSGQVQPGLENTSWEVPYPLPPGQAFWWRVRTVSGLKAGRWSVARKFVTSDKMTGSSS